MNRQRKLILNFCCPWRLRIRPAYNPASRTAMSSFVLDFHGQKFELLPDRAVWWERCRTLIIADLHLGKAATFRARGLPVPAGNTARDLQRLESLIQAHHPHRLLILGDLIHAPESAGTLQTFLKWRQQYPDLTVSTVLGNHDRHLPPEVLGKAVDVHDSPFQEAGLELMHEAGDSPTVPTLAGHLHPLVRLTDFDGSGIYLPCFVVRERLMILPAFSRFTGGCRVDFQPGTSCYVAAAGRVIPIENCKSMI